MRIGRRRRPGGSARDAGCCAPGAGADVAGAEQPLAQLVLLVGRRVPGARVGQVVERVEAEELEEQRRRAVEDGAELRAARLLDQPALEQRGRGRVGADAADAGDLRARDGLQVGDDRERLGLRGRQRRGARPGEQAPRGLLGARARSASVQPPASSRSTRPRSPGA